jgi:hypothetical protein
MVNPNPCKITKCAPSHKNQYNEIMNAKTVIFFSFVLLIVLGAVFYLVQSLQESALGAIDNTTAPFATSNAALQTQVSQLLNPTPTIIPDPVTYINEVRALARLETIQYSVEKVITAQIGQESLGFLFGDKLLFVAHGTVIAGIDMAKIMPEDMRLQNGALIVRLPAAEVFIATLDNTKSYVYNRETGILSKGTTDLETLARQRAEEEILKAATEDGILEQAQRNAELFLFKFFQALGYQQVIFVQE